MMDTMGLLQHHDSITGTESQAVANDYIYRLTKAEDSSNIQYKNILMDDMQK